MKRWATFIAWSIAAFAIVYAAVTPDGGVVYQGTTAPLAIGMIGLGLCLDGKKRMKPATVPVRG